jgi:hypothetical protein
MPPKAPTIRDRPSCIEGRSALLIFTMNTDDDGGLFVFPCFMLRSPFLPALRDYTVILLIWRDQINIVNALVVLVLPPAITLT